MGLAVSLIYTICAGDLHFYMRHSFQPSAPLEGQAQASGSMASQAVGSNGATSAAEEAGGSPQAAAAFRQRTFSMASFGSLDLRGSSSRAPSVASTLNDDPDAPSSSVCSWQVTRQHLKFSSEEERDPTLRLCRWVATGVFHSLWPCCGVEMLGWNSQQHAFSCCPTPFRYSFFALE